MFEEIKTYLNKVFFYLQAPSCWPKIVRAKILFLVHFLWKLSNPIAKFCIAKKTHKIFLLEIINNEYIIIKNMSIPINQIREQEFIYSYIFIFKIRGNSPAQPSARNLPAARFKSLCLRHWSQLNTAEYNLLPWLTLILILN